MATFVVGASFLTIVAMGWLGQRVSSSAAKEVTLIRDGRSLRVSTDARTVEDLLTELDINLGSLDEVRPALNAVISSESPVVEIKQGFYVKIVDGNKQLIEVTADKDPVTIVQNLGYKLAADETAVWHDNLYSYSLETIRVVKIIRQHDYVIKADGQTAAHRSNSRLVSGILADAGYDTEKVEYVHPGLETTVSGGDSIVVYNRRADQRIEVVIEEVVDNGIVSHQENVYRVALDQSSQAVGKRQLVHQRTISQSEFQDVALAELVAPAETVTVLLADDLKSVGDLSAQQADWLTQAGIDRQDWFYVDYIIFKESRWRPFVWNYAGSGAYGLCQTMVRIHQIPADFMTNPISQLKWCHQYALDRYGGWQQAYDAWRKQNWW